MPDVWSLLALQLVAFVGGMVSGAIALALGGLGGQRILRNAVADIKAAVERTDERITREVKTRAGSAGVQKRTEQDTRAEAERLLAENRDRPLGQPGVRPKVVS